MIVGAFAAQAFGVTRATFDVDLVVQLTEEQIGRLAERFAPPRYYADPVMMTDSLRRGVMFNLIDTTAGVKADLIPVGTDAQARAAFSRRIRQVVAEDEGLPWEVWLAHPTDIVIGKLRSWTEGRAAKHPDDIYALLGFEFSGLSSVRMDTAAITEAAASMGQQTLDLWMNVLARAERDTRDFDNV